MMKGQTLTVTLQEHHAQHHAQGVQVELLRRAVPRESSPEVAHPHAGQHHRRQAHQLRRPHQPREGGAAGTRRGVVHLLQGGKNQQRLQGVSEYGVNVVKVEDIPLAEGLEEH